MNSKERMAFIKDQRANGKTYAEIARLLGITKQRVQKIQTTKPAQITKCVVCGKRVNRTSCGHPKCSMCRLGRQRKPCDCGCGTSVPINWRFTKKCLKRHLDLTPQPEQSNA